jgi:hypothetical protein
MLIAPLRDVIENDRAFGIDEWGSNFTLELKA